MTTTRRHLDPVDWLSRGPLARLLSLLDQDGEEARVVGGAVRNMLLGEAVDEFDIATTALPAQVIARAAAAGFKPVPTGIGHGTVTVVVAGHPFEVTTLREDVETFGRRAKVAFGRDWEADAQRRDFTMNALSLSRDGTLHDYVGGLADLESRRVRFIGDPATRIAEDYLRILRFFRFHAAYGEGRLDPAGLHACIIARGGLDALSRERVRMETLKLLAARHAVAVLTVMAETGLLLNVLGGVPLLASFANMIKVEAVIGAARFAAGREPAGHPQRTPEEESGAAAGAKTDSSFTGRALVCNPVQDPVRRLGALGVFVIEDAERLAQRLRLSNAERERLASMADRWRLIRADCSAKDARALLYRLGPDRFFDRVLLAWTRSPEGAADERWRKLAAMPLEWTPPVFPLKAADFIARGVEKGPALGAALSAAESAWIAADFPSDRTTLAAIADQAVRAQ